MNEKKLAGKFRHYILFYSDWESYYGMLLAKTPNMKLLNEEFFAQNVDLNTEYVTLMEDICTVLKSIGVNGAKLDSDEAYKALNEASGLIRATNLLVYDNRWNNMWTGELVSQATAEENAELKQTLNSLKELMVVLESQVKALGREIQLQ